MAAFHSFFFYPLLAAIVSLFLPILFLSASVYYPNVLFQGSFPLVFVFPGDLFLSRLISFPLTFAWFTVLEGSTSY